MSKLKVGHAAEYVEAVSDVRDEALTGVQKRLQREFDPKRERGLRVHDFTRCEHLCAPRKSVRQHERRFA